MLGVSERTLLAVVIPAAPSSALVPRLRVRLGEVLRVIGVAENDIALESAAMERVAYGKATNRQVLGSMVDFAKALPLYADDPHFAASLSA